MAWLLLFALVATAVVLIVRVMKHQTEAPAIPLVPRDLPALVPSPAATRSSLPEIVTGNVLQPFSPVPMTVEGASHEQLSTLRMLLDGDHLAGWSRQARLVEWLLATNARVGEIDAFIAEWGPKFNVAIRAHCESDPDWESSGELDRDDILSGAKLKVTEHFDVRVADLDYSVVAQPPALDATADDSLLSRYGFENLSFYLRYAGDYDRVFAVPSDDSYRPRFEALLAKGLAKRGVDVAPEHILQTLTLKEMEAVAEGLDHKRFTRRAAAIAFLTDLPDLRERLGRKVSWRELFQPLPLPVEFSGLDLAALSHAWAFAAEYAKLLATTYDTAARAYRAESEAVFDEYFKGWVVEPTFGDECCPSCARQGGEKRRSRKAPRLPHHVGCTCHLSQIYE